jgi:hypothetical protein
MTFIAEHASALADLLENGSSVTFSYTTAGTYDEATDTTTGATSATVTGAAMRVKGNPLRYQALGLVQSEAPTLLFAPTTIGSTPPLGSSVTFGGVVYVVRDVDSIAPNGTAILARIVVVR